MRFALPKLLFAGLCLCATGVLAQPRLITTDAGATDLVFALGMGEQLIAVDVTSRLPAGHQPLPNIGYHRNLSAEGLLSLAPSAVIASEHLGPPEVAVTLQRAGVQLVRLHTAYDVDQLRANIRELASVFKQPNHGAALLTRLDSQVAALAAQPVRGPIAFLLAMEPSRLRLAGRGTTGHALIGLLGGSNAARFDNYRTVSAESLLALAPTTILVAGRDAGAAAELLAANPILKNTPAGVAGRIVSVDASTLVAGLSVAAVDEAHRVSTQLHGTAR